MNRRAILTIVATLAALGVLLLLLFLGAYSWRAYRTREGEQEARWGALMHELRTHPDEKAEYFRMNPDQEREYLRRESEYLRWEREHPDAGPAF